MTRTTLSILLAAALFGSTACGGEPALVSTTGVMAGYDTIDGIAIVPAKDVPPKIYTEDLASSQVFEIIRPNMAPISVGRLTASCTCIRLTMQKKDFAAGERALVELRNVKPTPQAGATYMIYVQLTTPVKETLQHFVFVKSGSPQPTPPAFSYDDIRPFAPSEKPRPSAAPAAEARPFAPSADMRRAESPPVQVRPPAPGETGTQPRPPVIGMVPIYDGDDHKPAPPSPDREPIITAA